ncbi:maleylpyruvate isomerase N-terminal domain-containing protein [Mycobacterium sp.]|uniref:maleylpyruvate isomerase N-terminal domain-containing protein n=1 Tax=Mycobacterium sp. TaxID=1785 RepID=UPI003F9951B9
MRTDTTPAGNRDHGAIWAQTRSRIVELLNSVPEGGANTPLPTAPGATVRDVVAHLVGTAASPPDSAALFPPSAGEAARSQTLAELLDRWKSASGELEGVLRANPAVAGFYIADAAMCEHDLRTALNRPAARDDESVKVALDELSGRFSDRAAARGLPPLRVTVEQWGTIIGDGRAVRCVVADRFEFVRAMSGRRSAAEIGRWNWGTDPAPYLPVISEAPLPEHEIHERDPRVPAHMRDREFVL